MKNLGEAGAQVSVITPNVDGDKKITNLGFMTIYRISKRFPFFPMFGLINEIRPDIIHVHAPNFFSSSIIAVAKLKNIPLIATAHRVEVDKVNTVLHFLRKLALQRFDKVVAVSNFTRSLAVSAGVQSENVIVVYNSCNESIFSPRDKLIARQKLGLPSNKKIILYVGNLIKRKGIDTLVESCKILHSTTTDFLTLILGNGVEREDLEKQVVSNDLSNKILFLSDIGQDKLPQYYNAADVFVLPSVSEGHAAVILEAMVSGLPVVASKTGGNIETVVDGVNGYLFDVGNSEMLAEQLRKIITDNSLGENMSLRSSEIYLKKFSTEFQIQTHLKVYHSLIDHSR
jgi:glycosyltransferase involved in cell wall biosynthesis